jgi:AraC-like DNA-binding protein
MMDKTDYAMENWAEIFAESADQPMEDVICQSILHQLDINKVYLDPKLSLTKFCSIVGTNTTYFSNAVNHRFGCNLKHLINWYRIRYAKSLLRNTEGKMQNIPAACGFASKSAFYASFKKLEGVTPIQYIHRNQM